MTVVIALSVSAVAVMLGMWQYERHEVKRDARAAYDVAQELSPVPLADVVPAGASELPADAEWRSVIVEGIFAQDSSTVLRGRPVDSTPALQYLAWLDQTDGDSVLVSTGWVPQPESQSAFAQPSYPTGHVTVTGIVRAWEDDDGKSAEDSVSRISAEQLSPAPSQPMPGYIMIREVCDAEGCSDTVAGEPVPLPELSLGPHLSYAWQWWIFAVLVPAGAFLLLRRDAREGTATATPTAVPRKKRRHTLSDEEIEDAL